MVLAAWQVEQFIEQGYCMLEAAFSRAQALAAQDYVWARMESKRGIRKDDPATWPDIYDIEEHLSAPEVLGCFTDRLASAVEQLLGPGRWTGERRWGFWPVNFSYGRHAPEPFPAAGWHIDGNWFRHTLTSPNQGLLVIGLFSDIGPGGGGTVVAQGSHQRTARVLAQHPEGLHHRELFDLVLAEPLGDFVEITGSAGDVALAHPFLFHNRSHKHAGPPRFISNTEAPLREPLNLARRDGSDYSVLEQSILEALSGTLGPPRDAVRCRF